MERRKDSVTAREIVIPLPRDAATSLGDRIIMAREFAWSHFVSKGVPVQLNLHDSDEGNPHAHLLIATRRLSDAGFAPRKALDLDPLIRTIHGRRRSEERRVGKE